MKILVADKLSQVGLDYLKAQNVDFDIKTGLSAEDLAKTIGQYDGIIIRSGAKLTAEVLANPGRLRAVARAGVGVDNVDLPTATSRGIIVMNTPGGNTLSTAELAVTLMMALSRKVVPAAVSLRAGKWDRKSYEGTQLSGKTLGVIGLGRIGRTVAGIAMAMGMKVVGYDPMLTAAAVPEAVEFVADVDELYKVADYITVHVPKTDATKGMIAAAQLAMMKPSVRLINAARGGIIDEKALLAALEAGTVAGAALDVYTEEPPASEHLRKLIEHPNVVAVPHLGASTEEAQEGVALEAAEIMVEALRGGEIRNAVNVSGATKLPESLRPYAELLSRMGTLLTNITPGAIRKVEVVYRGEIAQQNMSAVTTALTIGLLKPVLGDELNLVNAPVLAKERGINIETITSEQVRDFANLVQVEVTTDKVSRTAVGAIFGHKFPRVVAIDGHRMEMIPEGDVVICFNDDQPGVIGKVGDAFGEAGVNIASMTFGRRKATNKAVLALNVDTQPPASVLEKLKAMPFMNEVYAVRLETLPEQQRKNG
ncbi:MAG: phosphoglycerate dehydrogenase [Planctomycetes bacterium]|nr:phosphoglycerate dehydrogenase [Planctomycetota bacterium]